MFIKKPNQSNSTVKLNCKNLAQPEPNQDCLWSCNRIERWTIYRRLQQLEITAQCRSNQPLVVSVDSPLVALQVWSVVRQLDASRSQLVDWLETCWHQ